MSALPPPAPPPQRPLWLKFALSLAGIALGTVLTLTITDSWNAVLHKKTPSISSQIRSIESKMATKNYALRKIIGRAHTHATGPPSVVIVFRDSAPRPTRSDLLQIYDEDSGGHLKRQLEVQTLKRPGIRSLGRGPVSQARGVITPGDLIAANIDATPGAEIVLNTREIAGGAQNIGQFPRPFIIVWQSRTQRYVMRSLLSPSSVGHRTLRYLFPLILPNPNSYTGILEREVYGRAARVPLVGGKRLPLAFAVGASGFEVSRGNLFATSAAGHLVFTSAFVVADEGFGSPTRALVVRWSIEVDTDSGVEIQATVLSRKWVGLGPESDSLQNALRRP